MADDGGAIDALCETKAELDPCPPTAETHDGPRPPDDGADDVTYRVAVADLEAVEQELEMVDMHAGASTAAGASTPQLAPLSTTPAPADVFASAPVSVSNSEGGGGGGGGVGGNATGPLFPKSLQPGPQTAAARVDKADSKAMAMVKAKCMLQGTGAGGKVGGVVAFADVVATKVTADKLVRKFEGRRQHQRYGTRSCCCRRRRRLGCLLSSSPPPRVPILNSISKRWRAWRLSHY